MACSLERPESLKDSTPLSVSLSLLLSLTNMCTHLELMLSASRKRNHGTSQDEKSYKISLPSCDQASEGSGG